MSKNITNLQTLLAVACKLRPIGYNKVVILTETTINKGSKNYGGYVFGGAEKNGASIFVESALSFGIEVDDEFIPLVNTQLRLRIISICVQLLKLVENWLKTFLHEATDSMFEVWGVS